MNTKTILDIENDGELKNVAIIFYRVIKWVLWKNLYFTLYMYYIIIIFSTLLQEHTAALKAVFEKLRELKLKLQAEKFEYLINQVEFLGHIISKANSKKSYKTFKNN